MNHKIYILHEYGAREHYKALDYLLKEKNRKLLFREFSVSKLIIKSIIKKDRKLFIKQFHNIFFLLDLLCTKDKKIVLAIAPYDFRLLFLSWILRKHQIYYHTSWSDWSSKYYPKKLFVTKKLKSFWNNFLQRDIIKIFSVTQQTKEELVKHQNISKNKIKVVYHSYDENIFQYKNCSNRENSFLYVGRLVPEKGIVELLEYFAKRQNLKFNVVGRGILADIVIEYAKEYNNINYLGYVSDLTTLAKIYNENKFLLLNSKKTAIWEELFGMVIIESMACGVIPICSKHKGPKEIITHGINGYLIDENDFIQELDSIINNLSFQKYQEMQKNTILEAKKYSVFNLSKSWEEIING